jgi:3-oxoacyl-[acyl-carrier protein] reductase
METGIAGRVAVVAAASSGLGLASALALAREGARVVIGSRDPARLAHAQGVIAERAGRAPHTFPLDVSDIESVAAFVPRVRREVGPVAILVTNSGGPPVKRFVECTRADWESAFRLLLLGATELIRGFLPDMRAARWGRIVCITSMAAKEPMDNLVLSNSLRAAVTALAKTLARELAPEGIRVNAIAPGYHETPALERLVQKLIDQGQAASEADARTTLRAEVPVGRFADPEAFGRAVAFLASEACDHLTGVNLVVDGGRTRSTF